MMENEVLVLKWDKSEDNVIFDFTEIRERFDVIPTKSNVIKAIASIYDSLRVVKPNCSTNENIFPKVMLAKYDWDDLITDDYLEEWNGLIKSLSAIEFISVRDFTVITTLIIA